MHEDENIQQENAEEVNDVSKDQTIGQPKLQTSNQKLQTKEMEVHHHPDVEHKRKNWKEYFLEFVMIFLAVTLGFFAEGLRENISDNKKEKEYIKSFIQNLQDDTSKIRIVINDNQQKFKRLTTLM